MTIATTISRVETVGNGSTTVFAYAFKIFATTDLKVWLVTTATGAAVLQTITTHYSVSGAGDAGGGNVTMVTAPAATETLVVERHTPETQATDYVENDAFGADTHETALDRVVALVQQVTRAVGRSMRHAVGTPDAVSVELPFPVADEFIKWDSAGTALEGSAGTSGTTTTTYMATLLVATSEANFKALANLEAGTDFQAWDAHLDDLAALSVATADGEMMVATGAGAWALESGATLRTSVGVGTGDSPQFTGIELGHATDTTIARASAGEISVEGTQLAKLDGNLQDLDTLGAASSDGEIAVATGAGALAWESGATLRTSVGVGTGDSPVFAGLDVNGGELVLDADGDTSITADTDDQIDIKIAGADDFQMTANTFSVLSGSTLNIDSGATIANSGTATGFGSGLASGDVIPADDGSVGAPGLSFADDTDNGIYRIGANNFGVAVGGALAMEFDPIGAVQLPLQPLVIAEGVSQTDVTGDGTNYTILFATEIKDQNADFSSPTFTAPVSGSYQVSVSTKCQQLGDGHTLGRLSIVTSNRTWGEGRGDFGVQRDSGNEFASEVTATVDMDAADTLTTTLLITNSTKTVDIGGSTSQCFLTIALIA